MLIIVQSTWQWPITALMLYINLDSLPLFRCFDKISLYIYIFTIYVIMTMYIIKTYMIMCLCLIILFYFNVNCNIISFMYIFDSL